MPELSLANWLIIISSLVNAFGTSFYIKDTLKGITKPNRVSWFMWSCAPLIGTWIAVSSGADPWISAVVFFAGFLPLLVFISSFVNKNSYWRLTHFDLACGVLSVMALVAWLMADRPLLAIILAASADAFAALPTLFKAWNYPETETKMTYITGFISIAIAIPAIPEWNIENSAYQLYLLLANTTLLIAVYRKQIFGSVEKRSFLMLPHGISRAERRTRRS